MSKSKTYTARLTIASPAANEIMLLTVLTLAVLVGWYCALLDIVRAFLDGRFDNREEIHIKVPKGFDQWYPGAVLLLLLRTMYGTKQAAIHYWIEMQKAFKSLDYERSKADPCLYSY
jgi:hypothetical protein